MARKIFFSYNYEQDGKRIDEIRNMGVVKDIKPATKEEWNKIEDDLSYLSFRDSEFLALEEIGKEIDTKIAAPILEDLLRYREDKHLPTIVCTNLDIDTVEERYGYSIVSLIKGNMTPILIEGEDKRSNYYVDRTTS